MSASALTQAGIKHMLPGSSGLASKQAPLDASLMTVELTKAPRPVPEPESAEVLAQVSCTPQPETSTAKSAQ
jgi:branched-chain amino acid aminotransferase